MNLDLKKAVKMNLRIIMDNLAADPEIGFLTKSISKPYGRATAMPTAWKLSSKVLIYVCAKFCKQRAIFPGSLKIQIGFQIIKF